MSQETREAFAQELSDYIYNQAAPHFNNDAADIVYRNADLLQSKIKSVDGKISFKGTSLPQTLGTVLLFEHIKRQNGGKIPENLKMGTSEFGDLLNKCVDDENLKDFFQGKTWDDIAKVGFGKLYDAYAESVEGEELFQNEELNKLAEKYTPAEKLKEAQQSKARLKEELAAKQDKVFDALLNVCPKPLKAALDKFSVLYLPMSTATKDGKITAAASWRVSIEGVNRTRDATTDDIRKIKSQLAKELSNSKSPFYQVAKENGINPKDPKTDVDMLRLFTPDGFMRAKMRNAMRNETMNMSNEMKANKPDVTLDDINKVKAASDEVPTCMEYVDEIKRLSKTLNANKRVTGAMGVLRTEINDLIKRMDSGGYDLAKLKERMAGRIAEACKGYFDEKATQSGSLSSTQKERLKAVNQLMTLNDMLSAGKEGKPIRPLGAEGQKMLLAAKVVSGKMLSDAAQQRSQRVKKNQPLNALRWDTLQAQRKAVEKDNGFYNICKYAKKVPMGMPKLLHIKAEDFVKTKKVQSIVNNINTAERKHNKAVPVR